MAGVCPAFGHDRNRLWRPLALAALVLACAAPVRAAIFGVPTNLNAAGQVCTAVGTPAGCAAVSADPPGWFVLERLNSGSANGDVVHQIRLFVEVTGTTLDIRVFDAGLSGARDLGNPVTFQYRLLNPDATERGTLTIGADDAAVTENRLARFACGQGGGNPAIFSTLDTPLGTGNRIWGTGTGQRCGPLEAGLYIFEVTAQTNAAVEGRNAFGVEFLDSTGNPYNAYTIGNADDTIATPAATDTSMITGAVAGDRPTANVSGNASFFAYVSRGCTIDASNFDLDANNAEGNGSVATMIDTFGATTDLARSNNNDVATTTVTVEPASVANPASNNYGMFTLRTQLDEWATAQNHVDWRVADFQGSTAGAPVNLPLHPTSPIRTYLPHAYSACGISGCTLTAPQEPVLAASAVLVSGENPPLPGGATTRFAITATVANPGTTAITNVQITVPAVTATAGEMTYVAGSQTSTIDGAAAACTDASVAGAYRRCTFATLGAGQYASLVFEVDFQPPATTLRNLTGAPAAGAPPPNTTVWAQYTPASQSGTWPRAETLGPICQLSVNAAPTVNMSVIDHTDAPDPVTAGTDLTYSITVRNQSTATAPNPSMTDVLPPGTTFVSITPAAGWACTTPAVGASGTVRCSAATLASLTNASFTLVVRVASTVPNGTVLTNTASARSGGTDLDPSADSLSTTTTVVSPAASADLRVTKIDTPDPVAAGLDIAYTITVTNAGPATALGLTLADTVPANTTFRSIGSAQAWSCTTPAVGGTGSISCTLGSLAGGQASVLILRVRVNGATPAGTLISNTATVASAVSDPVPGNNSATATTTVAPATSCPTPGKDGPGGTLAGTINTYYPGSGTAAAGSTALTLGTSRGATTPIAIGDLLLIIQMQDATINTTDTDAYGDGTAGDGEARGATAQNSTGRYEYAVAASAVPLGGGALTVSQGLLYTYTTAAATGTQGQRRFQVIRVPQYTTATLGPTLTAAYWNGATGAVLVFDVQTTLALGSTTVSLTGRGFRGGGARQLTGGAGGSGTAYVSLAPGNPPPPNTTFHGSKGEGSAGTPRYMYDPVTLAVVDTGAENYPTASGSFARGAPGTAGGGGTDSDPAVNDENSGGGGGGNGGLGGRGGNAWNSNAPVGGFGGAGIAIDPGLMTLGAGGGAGSRNNSTGDQSSGNAGGGVVMIRADSLTGTGTIEADGLSANTADTTPANDGGGGGGAGGSVLVYAPNGGFAGLTVNARGGRGSDAWPTIGITAYPGERHGPGGGGGGGRVFLSGVPAAAVVTGGASGTTTVTPEVYGASDGNPGSVSTGITPSDIPGVDTTGACSPLAASFVDLGISVTGPADPLEPCASAAYVFTLVNNGPDTALDATASFPIPTSTTFQALTVASGWTCSTPAVGGTGTVTCTNPLFTSGASASFTLSVRIGCGTTPGAVISITGSVTTTSTDTYAPNNTTAMSNIVGAPLFVLTRASIRGLRVSADGLVEFATGWQQGTRGFHVYATDDPSGRTGLVRLTDELVPAPRPDSQTPILYSVRTGPISARYVLIEELERDGRRNRLGPFPVGEERLVRLLERVERRLERTGALDTALTSRIRVRGLKHAWREGRSRDLDSPRRTERRPALVATSLKIETAGTGIATVPRRELLGFGLPPDLLLSRCRLTNGGRRVAFQVQQPGTPDEALVFDAQALETPYTSLNVYVLTWANSSPRIAVSLTREGDPERQGFERVGRPVLYVASVPRGTDSWLWDQLIPGYGAWPYDWDPDAGRFDLPGWPDATGEPIPVRLRFQGMTAHRHVATVSLNGESLGSVTFEGTGTGYLEATSATLRSAGNELRIEYAAEDGDLNAYAYLDYFEAARPAGFVPQPVAATPRPFDDELPGLGAEYLIVTHPAFETQAARLAAAKRRQGLRVAVADVFNLYDRFSAGIPEANAVAELVRRMDARGSLRFVLLLGDDSFDPDDRTGLGGRTYVPSLNGWDGVFGRVASENRYADTDGDGRPELAIGRLPARTAAEAEALVAKVEQQQALLAAARGRQLFAVDNTGRDGFDFAGEARSVAAGLPNTSTAWADLAEGIGPARARLFSALAEGAAFTHYFGHGGPQTWADEGLLTLEDAASLPGSGTVVLTWTCLTQFYQYLFGPSVNEALMLSPTGGALAAFGPAGITDAPLQAALYERFYAELAHGGTSLGGAIQRAKARAVAEDPRVRPVVEGFNLLGDPALWIDPLPRH